MTALVTGATGLVGSHVLDELLERGEAVRALVRDPQRGAELQARGVEVIVGDIRDPAVLNQIVPGVHVTYHCAAAVGSQCSRREIYDTNLIGVKSLLEAQRQAGVGRLVLISSINVLGTRNLDCATEEYPCHRSHDPAADVKIEAERVALEYHQRHGVDVTILRPGFIYGPRDTRNLPQLLGAIRKGKFAYLGSRTNIVPIVHVSDVVQVMLLAGRNSSASGRIYHVTDGSRTTIQELVEYLAELVGAPPPAKVLPYFVPHAVCVLFDWWTWLRQRHMPGPITRAGLRFLGTSRFIDIRRAKEELGFAPRVHYREGVAGAVQWIKERANGTFTSSSVRG